MKIPLKSIVIICGFTATVFCFFHPVVATAITAVFLVHRWVMRKGKEVPKMLPQPLTPVVINNSWDTDWNKYWERFWEKSLNIELPVGY